MRTQKNLIKFKVFIAISIFFFIFSCSTKQIQEKKTEIALNIPVVYNPKNPEPPHETLLKIIIEEELFLGYEQKKGSFFPSKLGRADIDRDGNIYVVDREEAKVKVFNKDGRFVRAFGKKGRGPCKLIDPFYIRTIEGKGIMLYDGSNRRLSYYTFEGHCLEEVSAAKYRDVNIGDPQVDSKGNIMPIIFYLKRIPKRVVWMAQERRYIQHLVKFDPNFNPYITISSFEFSIGFGERPLIIPRFTHLVRKDDSIIWGIYSENSKYELYVANAEGKIIKKIVKEYNPVKIPEEEKAGRVAPEYFPPFRRITCDDEGKIYVKTYEKDKDNRVFWDVFDPEGRYITKFSLPKREMIFRIHKDHLYTLDEEGIPFEGFVKRYRVIWE